MIASTRTCIADCRTIKKRTLIAFYSHLEVTTFVHIVVFSCFLFYFMPMNPLAVIEVQCPGCGYKLNPITDQTKHASKLTPKITEEMIADEEGEGNSNILEVVEDEDSSRAVDEDDEEPPATFQFEQDSRRCCCAAFIASTMI